MEMRERERERERERDRLATTPQSVGAIYMSNEEGRQLRLHATHKAANKQGLRLCL